MQQEFIGCSWGSVESPIDSKFHFSWEVLEMFYIWDTVIAPKIRIPHSFTNISLQQAHFTTYECVKKCWQKWVANSVDPDQTPRTAASDLGLRCLLRPAFRNTKSKHGDLIN